MLRADALNLHVYLVRTEMTAKQQIPTSHVYSMDDSEFKKFLVDKTLSQICSTEKDEPKIIIVDECFTEEDESQCVHKNINKKVAKNEAEYEESSVTDEVPRYFKIFECGRNILNRLDVTNERVCMAPQKEEYYKNLLETMFEHNDCHNVTFSNEKLRQAVSKIMAETEEEEWDAKRNTNNVTTDNFIQPPVTTNTPRKKTDVADERKISSDSLAETIKLFYILTLQSTINDSADYHSDKNNAKSHPKINQVVATHTSDGKERNLLILTLPKEILHTNY